jgi:hypothetical protein
MTEAQLKRGLWLLLLMAGMKSILTIFAQSADNWTPPVEVRKGKLKAVAYQAQLAGDTLLIRAAHEPGWHTYALDNLERAKKKAGEPPLGIEKNTSIKVSGGLEVTGKWRQSPPKDLSQREINWYTWGFEGVTLFAARVKPAAGGEAVITINGQACKASLCALIDDLEIRLPLNSSASSGAQIDLSQLVEAGDPSKLQ